MLTNNCKFIIQSEDSIYTVHVWVQRSGILAHLSLKLIGNHVSLWYRQVSVIRCVNIFKYFSFEASGAVEANL